MVTVVSVAHLDGSLKELDGDVVFPLQTETVSCDTPGLQTGSHITRDIWTGVVRTGVVWTGAVVPQDSFCPCQSGLWTALTGPHLSASATMLSNKSPSLQPCRTRSCEPRWTNALPTKTSSWDQNKWTASTRPLQSNRLARRLSVCTNSAPAVSYLCVLGQFEVSPANMCEDPSGVVVLRREGGEDVDGFPAVVRTQRLVTTSQFP